MTEYNNADMRGCFPMRTGEDVREVIRGCFVKRHFASRKLKGRKERMIIPIMAIKKRGSFARAFIRLFADIPAILGRGLFMIICINNDTHTILPHMFFISSYIANTALL